MRLGLGIISLAIVVSAATDLFFLRWQQPALHLVQIVQLVIVGASYSTLRRSAPKRVVEIATLSACALYAAMAVAGIVSHDDLTTPLELNVLTVGTASLLPWGTLPQLVTAMVAAAAILANIFMIRSGLDLAAVYPTLVASALTLGASVYIANKLAQALRLTADTDRQRRDAESALRRAHAELELRVAQRTAELQATNRALEQQIVERKQLEEVARQHQAELAQATRLSSVGQMAVEMAHELNQPLAAITNFARGCARHLESNTANTGELLDTVEEIAAQALRAGSIIRRIASVARKPATPPERTPLNDLVHEVARLMSAEAQRLGITLRLDVARQLPTVLVDRIQIEEVIVNLIRNACDAMDGCAGTRELLITTATASPSVVAVAVRDTGRGLTPEIALRIFEPFYTTRANGLGLGLSISRSIVEAHGGDLQAIPNDSGGTTFRFTLPAAAPA